MKSIAENYRNLSIQMKASLWFVICSFLQKGVSLITVPIFTRVMSREEYGIVTLFTTWTTVFTIFATLNLSGSVYNRGLLKYNEDKYTSSIQSLASTCTILLTLVLFVFHKQVSRISGLNTEVLMIMCPYFLFVAGFNLWTVRERFHYRYKKLVAFTLCNTVLSTGLGLLAVLLGTSNKGVAKVIWSTIGLIVFAIPFYIFNFVKGKKAYDHDMWKFSLAFSLPLIPHYLSNVVLNQSDKVMINMFAGKEFVALYGVSYSIGSIVRIFLDAISATLTPWRYQSLEKKNYREINDVSIKVLLLVGAGIVFINLFAPEILMVFGSKEYQEGVWCIPPIMLSMYFIYLYSMYSNVEFYFLKTKFMMVASSLSALLNIILNFWFLKWFGYIACAYTSLFCYVIYCVGHHVYMRRVCRAEIGVDDIYDVARIIKITVVTVLMTVVSTILYRYFVVRYVLILLVCAVCAIKRNHIKQYIVENIINKR